MGKVKIIYVTLVQLKIIVLQNVVLMQDSVQIEGMMKTVIRTVMIEFFMKNIETKKILIYVKRSNVNIVANKENVVMDLYVISGMTIFYISFSSEYLLKLL